MLRLARPSLALLATLALLGLAPAASAEALWDPAQAPCDGQPLAPGAEDEDQVRVQDFACTYGPYFTGPVCATAAGVLEGALLLAALLAPDAGAPASC